MITFRSETWEDVKDEFDELGRKNFEECNIADGKTIYSLNEPFFDWLGDMGLIQVTTAREDGKLIGYILNFLSPRHPLFDAFTSQQVGMYLLPEKRKGMNGMKLLKADEAFLQQMGVQLGYRGDTIDKNLAPILLRSGWAKKEVFYTKWLGELNG